MEIRWHQGPARIDTSNIVLELVNHIDAMVAFWNADQICMFANDAYLLWFGRTREEMRGISMRELLGPIYSLNLPYIEAALAGNVQSFEREIHSPDGRTRHSLATYTPHFVDGKVAGIFVHVADVTSLKEMEQRLLVLNAEAEKLATHDFLTGLPNRVLLQDRIQQGLALARRGQQQVAMLSVDLDEFKQINDNFGHHAGDQILKEVALRLSQSLRASDSVTRMGGDEFLVLLPMVSSRREVEMLATRIIKHVSRPMDIDGQIFTPACSIGIALCAPDETNSDLLIRMSDRALYVAKKLGKNCYSFSPGQSSF